MVENAIKLILFGMLLLCGAQDALKKKVHLGSILLGAVCIGICVPFSDAYSIWDRIGGIAVGIIIAVVSMATAGKIGMGDALIICITGLSLGFWGNLELFAIALLLAAVVSIILLIFRLADRKKSIPFIPFLMFAYVFLLFVGR